MVVILFTISVDKSYCMDDLNQNINFDMDNEFVFNDILLHINANNKLLQQYKEQISKYRQNLENIINDMTKTSKLFDKSLTVFSKSLHKDMDTESNMVNNNLRYIHTGT